MKLFSVKQGQISIVLVCVVLGMMLAVQFRTAQDIKANVPFQRVEELSKQLTQSEKEREALVKEVQELKRMADEEVVSRNIDNVKMGAGLISVQGPGIVIKIDDSKRPSKPGENPNLYIIHDDDILKVINELWAAGAEAVSINDQRLVVNSEIRCAGPTLSVNNTRHSPPYEVKAIGNQKTLESALKMRGGVIETLQFWGIQISVNTQNNINIPGFNGAFRFEYAKPVTAEQAPTNPQKETKEGDG